MKGKRYQNKPTPLLPATKVKVNKQTNPYKVNEMPLISS